MLHFCSGRKDQRIIYALVNCFFDARVERVCARPRLATIKTAFTLGSSADAATIRDTNDNHDTRVAHNMSRRFETDDRFSGKIVADINELNTSHKKAVLEYELSATQKPRYFHNLFEDYAKGFLSKICTTHLYHI